MPTKEVAGHSELHETIPERKRRKDGKEEEGRKVERLGGSTVEEPFPNI